MREKESGREGKKIKHITIMNAYSEVQNSFDVSSWPAGQENKCFFILIEKINSLTWCLNISTQLSHFHFILTTGSANVRAEVEERRGAMDRGDEMKERTWIKRELRKFSRCNLINNGKWRDTHKHNYADKYIVCIYEYNKLTVLLGGRNVYCD